MAYAIGTDKKDGTVQPSKASSGIAAAATRVGSSAASTPVTRTTPAPPKQPETAAVVRAQNVGKAVADTSTDDWNKSATPSTSATATKPGFTTPTEGGTRTEQRVTRPAGGLNSDKFYQRVADNGGVVPFEGPVDWGGIYDYLQAPANRRLAAQPAEITVRGGTPMTSYDRVDPDTKLSFGMLLDLLQTPEVGTKGLPGLTSRPVRTYQTDNEGNPIFDDRLPAEPLPDNQPLPPSVYDPNASVVDAIPDGGVDEAGRRTSEFIEPQQPLGVDERWGFKSPYFDMGRLIRQATADDPYYSPLPEDASSYVDPGAPVDPTEPSTWDNVVDNTGKLLSHSGLGAIVSTLFPDLWSSGGDMMKGLFDGERGTATANGDFTRWDPREGVSMGGGSSFSRDATGYVDTTPSRLPPGKNVPPGGAFPDLNHNGIDDRLEGYTGPDTQPPIPPPAAYGRTAQFPDMPPYNPGRDDEWLYFLNNHLADGGMVEAPAYADGGMVEAPTYADGGAIDQSDPRVQLIGQTEDVLERLKAGEKPDEAAARTLKAFVAQFGDAALKSLHDNVGEGMSMKSGRLIKGPGGPKDDAVPAVIVEEGSTVSPAKLSNNEFVMPVSAVEGIGEGDVEIGAQRMQELADRLSQKA